MSKKGKFNFKNIFNNVKELEPLKDIDTRKPSEIFKSRIADLEAKLAESEKENKRISSGNLSHSIYVDKKIERLEQQLAEKDKQLRTKIGNMKSNEFIKMCISCGFMVDAKEKDNQDKISFAVEKLEKVKDIIYRFDVSYDEINNLTIALDNYTNGFHKAKFKATMLIDNQIKQLKEAK